jgi:hypothetical protein
MVIADMTRFISFERLRPFYADCSGNSEATLQLYAWNAALTAAFVAPLGAVEVGLRNALSERLTIQYGVSWYDEPRFISIDQAAFSPAIARAKRHIAASGRPVTSSTIVSQLSFGFWTLLLRPSYARTSWPVLRPAFIPYTRRRRAADAFEPLVAFRNRIAHHRIIYDREPQAAWDRLRSAAHLLSPNLRSWIDHHERVSRLLAEGPIRPQTTF